MAWRNDQKLYRRKCDQTGKDLISMFRPDSKVPVVDKDFWYSDEWEASKYGRDFDFNRPFFEQFNELLQEVPMPHIMISKDENSIYTNYTYCNKNCYLCFAGNFLEDSMYCYNAQNSRDCELCYECVHSSKCYNCRYLLNSSNCRDCYRKEVY